jgi:1-acyl-sn-glycerol-3-phosphate acyltransferase
LFAVPVLKDLIRLYGAYPVNRSAADRQAIKAALSALSKGWAVGIFLEGTRTSNARIADPKLGAALIASMAKVPLLPISLWGTENILKRGSSLPQMTPLTIRMGDMIAPPSSKDREELLKVTQECANAINYLHTLGR